MAFEILPAARKWDPIEHSFGLTGQLVGAVLGVIVGAAVVVGVALLTEGVGLLFIVGALLSGLSIGAALGKIVGKLLPKAKSGFIKDGSPTIFYGPQMRNAARVTDPLVCQDPIVALTDKLAQNPLTMLVSPGTVVAAKLGFFKLIGAHPGKRIESGVQDIFYDEPMLWASRIKDRTECDGHICEGIETILLGGETGHTRTDDEVSEDSPYVEWTLWGLEWVNTLLGLGAERKGIMIAGMLITGLGQFLNHEGYKRAGFIVGLAGDIVGLVGGADKTKKLETAVSVLASAQKEGLTAATTEFDGPRPLTPVEQQMRNRARQHVLSTGHAY